jgi:hypothetical protein
MQKYSVRSIKIKVGEESMKRNLPCETTTPGTFPK